MNVSFPWMVRKNTVPYSNIEVSHLEKEASQNKVQNLHAHDWLPEYGELVDLESMYLFSDLLVPKHHDIHPFVGLLSSSSETYYIPYQTPHWSSNHQTIKNVVFLDVLEYKVACTEILTAYKDATTLIYAFDESVASKEEAMPLVWLKAWSIDSIPTEMKREDYDSTCMEKWWWWLYGDNPPGIDIFPYLLFILYGDLLFQSYLTYIFVTVWLQPYTCQLVVVTLLNPTSKYLPSITCFIALTSVIT